MIYDSTSPCLYIVCVWARAVDTSKKGREDFDVSSLHELHAAPHRWVDSSYYIKSYSLNFKFMHTKNIITKTPDSSPSLSIPRSAD